jgi:hypothetical protein
MPRRVALTSRLRSNATLSSFEEADLFAKVSGYLSEVRVDIGDHVKAGQVLAVIDIPETARELREAGGVFRLQRQVNWRLNRPGVYLTILHHGCRKNGGSPRGLFNRNHAVIADFFHGIGD